MSYVDNPFNVPYMRLDTLFLRLNKLNLDRF